MKLLKKSLLFILTLLFTFSLMITIFWFNLGTIFSPELLSSLNKKYFKELKVDWNKLDISINSEGLINKNIIVKYDSCIAYRKSSICFAKLLIDVDIKPLNSPFYELKTLKAEISKGEVFVSDFVDKSESDDFSVSQNIKTVVDLINSIKKYSPENYSLIIRTLAIFQDDLIWKASASVDVDRIQLEVLSKVERFKIDLKKSEKDGDVLYSGRQGIKTKDMSLSCDCRFFFSEIIKVYMNIDIDYLSGGKEVEDIIEPNVQLTLETEVSNDFLKINLVQSKVQFKKYLEKVSIDQCHLELPLESGQNMSWNCPRVNMVLSKELLQKNEKMVLYLQISGELAETLKFSKDWKKLGELKFLLKNRNPSFLGINLKSQWGIGSYNKSLSIIPEDLEWNVDIGDFSKLTKYLAETEYAIPAPFNTFNGKASFSSKPIPHLGMETRKFPIGGKVDLKGEADNSIQANFDGSYKVDMAKDNLNHHLDLKVILQKFYIYLPKIDPIRGIPQVKQDSRVYDKIKIQEPSKKVTKKENFTYKINVVGRNSPIRVYYYLFKPYMSFNLDVVLTNTDQTLTIEQKKDFNIDYLKRRVSVKKFKINIAKDSDDLPIEAQLLYETSGYNIYIDIIGKMDGPRVLLSSYPELPREDIISLLIFNRRASEISSFENESVGSTEAALTDRAIGLLGIWAFASTPIETVSYNPRSKIYAAQIALPEGVRFSVGTDWERVQNLQLKKRLSQTWVLMTSYEPGEESKGKGNLFLQKEFSY